MSQSNGQELGVAWLGSGIMALGGSGSVRGSNSGHWGMDALEHDELALMFGSISERSTEIVELAA